MWALSYSKYKLLTIRLYSQVPSLCSENFLETRIEIHLHSKMSWQAAINTEDAILKATDPEITSDCTMLACKTKGNLPLKNFLFSGLSVYFKDR